MSAFTITDVALPSSLSRTVRYPPKLSRGVSWSTRATNLVLRLLDHELTIVADELHAVPVWVEPVWRGLLQLEQLPLGWDSYEGRPVSRRHLNRALSFLGQAMTDETALPDLVPLADGGIQLEWRRPGLEVDLITDEETDEPLLLVTEMHETKEYLGSQAVVVFRRLRHRLASEQALPA